MNPNSPEPHVYRYPDAHALGRGAASRIAEVLRHTIDRRGAARVVFAAAPSQSQTLQELASAELDWSAVTAFHMDEYVGLDPSAPQRFGNWLSVALFDRVPLGAVELLSAVSEDGVDAEITRYTELLGAAPIDLVVCGIGTNAHLAFNDPPADFSALASVMRVRLSEASRVQQVDDGLFASLDDVPELALTLTVPALLAAREIVCVVPGAHKANAVRDTLLGPITEDVPASALRTHSSVSVHLDQGSARLLPPDPASAASVERSAGAVVEALRG